MGKIYAFGKIGCPHSIAAADALNNLFRLKLRNNYAINVQIEWFNTELINKDEFFSNIKASVINQNEMGNYHTFPVIIYETTKHKRYFIGGNDVLQDLIRQSDVYEKKLFESLTEGRRRLLIYLLILKDKIN